MTDKILLVEDESVEAIDIRRALEKMGYEVVYIASRGEEAVEKISELQPDLILMDIMIKGDISGIDVATEIKDMGIPVIFLTAHSDESTLAKAKVTEPYGYIIKPYDVTELRHAIELAIYKNRMEKKLKTNAEFTNAIIEASNDFMFLIDPSGVILTVNDATSRRFNITPDEMIGKHLSLFLPENIFQNRWEHMEEAIKTREVVEFEDERDKKYFHHRIFPLVEEGEVQKLAVFVREITERKSYERELIRNSLHLKKAQELGHMGSWDWDIATGVLNCSEELYRIFGVDETFHPTFENIDALTHPDDREMCIQKREELFRSGGKCEYEFRILRSDGEIRHLKQSIQVLFEINTKSVVAFGIMQDVTEIEKSKIALVQSEQKYRDIFENAIEGIYQTTQEGKIINANPAFARVFGFSSPEELIENVQDIQKDLYAHPEDRDEFKRRLETEGEVKDFEVKFFQLDGTQAWLLVNAKAVKDGKDHIKYYEGMVVDITRLKEAEKAVTESEEKYRSVIEQSYNGVVLSNEEGKIIEWNRSMEEITGLAENEVHGKYLSTIILQSLPPMFKSHLASHLKEDLSRIYRDQEVPPSFKKLEYSFQRPDGQERFVEALNFPIKSGGKFFMCTLIRDISRQKIAEEMTQDHLQKLIILNKIVNIANNAQNIYDLFKGVLNSTLHLLGFESGSIYLLDENKEFAELEYYENLPEEFLEKVEKLEVAREPYSSIYLEGKAFYNYLKVRPVLKEFGFKAVAVVPFFSAQKVIGSIHVVSREKNSISSLEMDILETIGMETGTVIVKMYSEAAIRDSLAEKEVLLKEIHHRVKNNMQIISSLLNLQLQHVQEEEASNVLIESQGRVKTMAMIHEKLYQSPDLTRIRFRDYIQKLAYDILYTYGVKAGSIELEMDIDNIELGMETSIPCGLIINELVTNSVKYAFPEGKGTIIIQFKGQDELQLIIKDDGIGLPREIDLEHTETLGLQLVLNLVKQLNGELTINRSQGTEYIIKFKELQYSKRF